MHPITVRELTVAEVKSAVDGLGENEDPLIPMLYETPLPLSVLEASIGMSGEEMMDRFTVAELAEVIAGAEEVNDRLKKYFSRLAEVGRAALAEMQSDNVFAG